MPAEPPAAVVESYADLARSILARPPRLGGTRLVAVDGPSGAGKSFFADRLAAAFTGQPRPPVVHTDDLLDGWADQFTFWPRLERWVLDPLRHGRPGRYRRYDWLRQRFTTNWVDVPAAPVVILEGVSAARALIFPELTLTVLVTAALPVRRARTLARDGPQLQPQLAVWRAGEEVHFAADRTAARADLIVDTATPLRYDRRTHYVRSDRYESPRSAAGGIRSRP